MLAAQAAVALANIRASEGLEPKVAERTAEAQVARERAEQRASELAVINSIQQGMAAQVSFQGIVELVGDRLREVFDTGNVLIIWWDEAAGQAPLPVCLPARPARDASRRRGPTRTGR